MVSRLPPDHDPADRPAALERALESGERLFTGVFYRRSGRPLYAERFRREVSIKPLAALPWPPKEQVEGYLFKALRYIHELLKDPGRLPRDLSSELSCERH